MHKKTINLIDKLFIDMGRKKPQKISKENNRVFLEYFCNEKFEEVKKSGVIFYCMLNLLLSTKDIEKHKEFFDKLCLFEIENSRLFAAFINPELYFTLLMDADKNVTSFTLLIISLAFGTKGRIFWFLTMLEI